MTRAQIRERSPEWTWLLTGALFFAGLAWYSFDPTFQTVSGYGAGVVASLVGYDVARQRRRSHAALTAVREAVALLVDMQREQQEINAAGVDVARKLGAWIDGK